MKLLLDANLSWRLTKLLASYFQSILHIDRCGLPVPANDLEIWNWAKKEGYIIVTNDEDFYTLLVQRGFPPKMVLIRLGNQSTKIIKEVLIRLKPQIQSLHDREDYGILEII